MACSFARISTVCGVLLLVGLYPLLLGALGCDGPGSSTDPAAYHKVRQPEPGVFEDMAGASAITREGATVLYSEGLSRQAERFAGLTAKQLSYIRVATGCEFPFEHVNLYLRLVDGAVPERAPHYSFPRSSVPGFSWGLFVEPDRTSCEEILAANPTYPAAFMHELAELSLVMPMPVRRLLLDYRRKTLWGRIREDYHYTRWFREGFATYAGFLACQTMLADDEFNFQKVPAGALRRGLPSDPFSSLAKAGKSLFAWHQYHEYPAADRAWYVGDPHPPDTEIDYYAAALGLFLVVEARYGQDAIREIVQKVNKLVNGTGEDVRRIVDEVLGTDIVELAKTFCFPRTGLEMVAIYPPNPLPGFSIEEGLYVAFARDDSPAQRAGIRGGDVVVGLDGERTVTVLDFELALYERMDQESVKMKLWRKGKGEITVECQVAH